MKLANLITVSRFPVLLIVVLLVYYGGTEARLVAAGLTLALILMDSLDGIVARRRGEETLLGSALDIAADRAVEIVLWMLYAYLRLIPLGIPMVIVVRGVLTDSIRSVALQHGYSAHRMMRSRVGHWLVASPAMRIGYAVAKVGSFVLLAVGVGLGGIDQGNAARALGVAFSWIALAMCLARGLPVLVEAPRFFRSLDGKSS